MIYAIILFLVPVLLFVIAFLFETYLSFKRLKSTKPSHKGYVQATWEVTHTLLVIGVVFLVMMFTQNIEGLSSAIFTAAFIAISFLLIRAICYAYIFYGRKKDKVSIVDWIFAFSHLFAAVFLVIVVIQALWYIYKNNPAPNTQFFPYFLPGLIVVIAIVFIPLVMLYSPAFKRSK